MDEVRMVRDSYPEPAPPTAREIAEARALLNDPPRRALPRLRWGLGGVLTATVAAGAAAAVAIAVAGGSTPAPAGTPGPVTLDEKGAVLAAAEKAARQPGGKYWYADVVQGQAYVIRAKTGTYAITGALSESFNWFGVKPGMGEAFYARDLGARPQTPQDEALWRKAGSPSAFRVWSGDKWLTFPTKAAKWRTSGPEVGTDPRGGGEFQGDSVADLQKLPTDPAKLAELFLSDDEMNKALGRNPTKRLDPVSTANMKISRVSSLLDGPIPPKVRAGLVRALAAQPGIQAIGRVTDPLGRRGVALAAPDRAVTVTGEYGEPKATQGTYRWRDVIVFDERTGALLSQQTELTQPGGPYKEMKPGFIIYYSTTHSAAWTDTKPKAPAGLPFD